MCDTVVALGNVTEDGSVIFGKNSDREPNEAHELILFPAEDHEEGATVRCTYIEIPQVKRTNSVLLAKPFWIWGAEMGANEYQVVIGNEAVFTRVPHEKSPGLIGMDFIRLALERSKTAFEALTTITRLLEQHGQAGNCGFRHELFYHNSFIIADTQDAWVLETAGRQWVAEKVIDVRSISNALSIETKWDLSSNDLIKFASDQGWYKKREPFNFKLCYGGDMYSKLVTRLISSQNRQTCSGERVKEQTGNITVKTVMQTLRQHRPAGSGFRPKISGLAGSDICAHASMGPVRGSQTTGSMVSQLSESFYTHWLTGTAAPCTGIFKPVWMDSGLPDLGPSPVGEFNPETLWWQHELLHRRVMLGFSERLAVYVDERDRVEAEFLEDAKAFCREGKQAKSQFTDLCFHKSKELTRIWTGKVSNTRPKNSLPILYRNAWKGYNQEAKLPEIN